MATVNGTVLCARDHLCAICALRQCGHSRDLGIQLQECVVDDALVLRLLRCLHLDDLLDHLLAGADGLDALDELGRQCVENCKTPPPR
jgi:hypothetical protein